jgi:predicted ATPase
MQSWEMLQLEPTAMRESDRMNHPPGLSANGGHMPATLFELGRIPLGPGLAADPEAVYQRVWNRLEQLLGEVSSVRVESDEARELLTIYLLSKHGGETSARSLSDGTLSFLALILKQMESVPQRLICMEEPENGIHPKRIDAILSLLEDISTETTEAVGEGNPLRQVIINTHSPAVVQRVAEDSLLLAELLPFRGLDGILSSQLGFSALSETWRLKAKNPFPCRETSLGSILAYLQPASPSPASHLKRVIDRREIQMLLGL